MIEMRGRNVFGSPENYIMEGQQKKKSTIEPADNIQLISELGGYQINNGENWDGMFTFTHRQRSR